MSKRLKDKAGIFLLICAIFSVTLVTAGRCFAQGKALQLVFLRHAEKQDDGEHLSCAGFNRSVLLAPVLYKKFRIPEEIFVPSLNLGRITKKSRMLETILPFAIKYNLRINSKYEEDDSKGLAADLLQETGTVIIVWDHTKIPDILHALGVTQYLKWSSDDFDSMWIVTFSSGKPKLLIDHEDIAPPKDCPF